MHYTIERLPSVDDARERLKSLFPTGDEVNEMNLVMFSTSGVHGTYTTIEDIEASLAKYGSAPDGELGEDYAGDVLTVAVLHPRLVCLQYGNIRVRPEDIDWLKKLRARSREAFLKIGAPDE